MNLTSKINATYGSILISENASFLINDVGLNGREVSRINIFEDIQIPMLDNSNASEKAINSAITVLSVAVLLEVMLGMGCSVDLTDLKEHLKKPIGVLAAAITQFGLMPLIAFGLSKGLHLGAVPAIATLLTASVPGGSLSNILTYLAKGDMSLSMLMTTVSTLLALGFIPLNLFLYGSAYLPADKNATSIVPFPAIIVSFVIMLLPMSLGIFLHKKFPQITRKVMLACKIMLLLTLTTLVILSCFLYGIQLLIIMPKELWLISSTMPIIGYCIGFALSTVGGMRGDARRTVAIEAGCQNCQLSVAILKVAFPVQVIGSYFLFPFIYAMFQFIEGFLMILVTRLFLQTSCSRENSSVVFGNEHKRTFSTQKLYDAIKISFWKNNIAEDKENIIKNNEDILEDEKPNLQPTAFVNKAVSELNETPNKFSAAGKKNSCESTSIVNTQQTRKF